MHEELQPSSTAVEKYFFTSLYHPRSPLQVIAWWKRRCLAYNASVGLAGLMSLGVVALLQPAPQPPSSAFMPWLGVLIYGVAANL